MSYQTEEQQLEQIRDFFKANQNVILACVLVFLCAMGIYRYWDWHQTKIKTEASSLYDALLFSASHNEDANIQAYAGKLTNSYPRTVYAQAAQLALAKFFVAKGEWPRAKQALQSVIDHASVPALQQIARLRLARILIQEKNNQQALTLLKVRSDKAYESVVLELEGDIYMLEKNVAQAKLAYEAAQQLVKQKGMNNGILDMKLTKLNA